MEKGKGGEGRRWGEGGKGGIAAVIVCLEDHATSEH